MAMTHAPGTGLGGGNLGKGGRRAAVLGAVVLAVLAIVVPFAVHDLQHRHPAAAPVIQRAAPHPSTTQGPHHVVTDSALGARGDLPSLLPDRSPTLTTGQSVRLGDITTGSVRRAPTAGWQVLVRWDGKLQPLTTRGSVSLGADSWVSRAGLLYSRVPTGTPGRFHVFAWSPQGGTAYTPPTLVATALGDVCFNPAFTAFGGCQAG
jgi:hypothetical protein